LRPAAFSARALSVTAIVADGFTRSSAADKKDIIISGCWLEKAQLSAKLVLRAVVLQRQAKSTDFAGTFAALYGAPINDPQSKRCASISGMRESVAWQAGAPAPTLDGPRTCPPRSRRRRHRRAIEARIAVACYRLRQTPSITTTRFASVAPQASQQEVAPAREEHSAHTSPKRDHNCCSVLERLSTALQCSRAFRLFPVHRPCGACASAPLSGRVTGRYAIPSAHLSRRPT
jgi:hypothetical protein